MAETWTLRASVMFGDVDRDNLLALRGVFKLLQEAAIAHANHYDTGTGAMITRGESWVLNRMAVDIARYPGYGEPLRVETWSSGIRGFKGYRDFRVYDAQDRAIVAGSSLWIYVSVRTRAIIRVPREVAEHFPSSPDGVHCPGLETLEFAEPAGPTVKVVPVSLRYSDIDANAHVNNTAYLDLVQTALAAAGRAARPRSVRIKYGRGIPAGVATAEVRLGALATGEAAFSVIAGDEVCAVGGVG